MLNCCIERKRLSKIRTASQQFLSNVDNNSDARTKNSVSNAENLRKSDSSAQMESLDSQSSISDDDEFFEAVESQEESENEFQSGNSSGDLKNIQRTDSDLNMDGNCTDNNTPTGKREGAKEPFGDLKLLVSGEPLIVPITQVCSSRLECLVVEILCRDFFPLRLYTYYIHSQR